jgi:penicillin-binding protein 1B
MEDALLKLREITSTIKSRIQSTIDEKVRPTLQRGQEAINTHRRHILAASGLVIFFTAAVVIFEVSAEYAHCAAIVDTKLSDRVLQQPAGIYAAPRRLSVGQQITSLEIAERLQRAGYREGNESDEFAVGHFTRNTDSIEVTNRSVSDEEAPTVIRIRFGKQNIVNLEDAKTGEKIKTLVLAPEMLTADLDTKRQTRRATSFEDLPDSLIKALCAIEDRRFFSHSGVDPSGILRAAYTNLRHGEIREGGSTITQQLVKNEFLTAARTWDRKLTEAMMAIALEKRLTKQQIFTLYSERVYLGHSGITSVYGFRQGAKIFLGKELSDLTLADAAFLAGLVKAPNRYAPHARTAEAIARRNVVIDAMASSGRISEAEAANAKGEQLALLPPQNPGGAASPWFVDYVNRELVKRQVESEDGLHLRVETTLDSDLQQTANQVVSAHLNRISKLVAKRNRGERPEAALIALDPRSGEILAMVGGNDYVTSQLNRATDAMRQPGSVFKPVVYASALARGYSPATTFVNEKREITYGYRAVYRPQNFGHSYSNQPVTLRESLIRSLNVVAVDAAMQVGLENVASLAERMGLPRPDSYPSLALGAFEATPLDVARAYTVFANNGVRVDPVGVRSVKSDGTTIYSGEAGKMGVLPSTAAYLVTDALIDVVNRGTGAVIRKMGYRGPAAGKTGTSRDAWFVGYTPKLLVVVWVGFDDNRDLGLTGGEAAAPIWADFVKNALALRPDLNATQFTQPAGLQLVEVDSETGAIANEFCPRREKMLMSSSLATGICLIHQQPLEMPTTEEIPSETPVETTTDVTNSEAIITALRASWFKR